MHNNIIVISRIESHYCSFNPVMSLKYIYLMSNDTGTCSCTMLIEIKQYFIVRRIEQT